MGLQMPSQNGGMGANYGASGIYSNSYGMLVTAMYYNLYLEKLCHLDKYQGFVEYIDIAGQFDTDYNMPYAEVPVNNRNPLQEIVGTNGVHPSIYGYYQIADAVYRSLCNDFGS
jgi:lysophospholipase L1-like esterase